MKKQMKKLVMLLGLAGVFCLMSFNEPRWFDKGATEDYCLNGGTFTMLIETWYSYYGYCVCKPDWFGDRCEFYENDL